MTSSEAFRAALLALVDGYVETDADAADAIDAMHERIDALDRWKEKQDDRHADS